ncbi:hypothetical protein FOZ61_009323 [Perkinsus olseni]|uniref:Uncharacterized protein n=1 Tax=Perkinsus olseni TaxID=32597 RepID=A0A7J6L2N9_PEROL|nr:hypothetical protein FOZ61_009323 [Perkinsus olseni]KAF4655080.1 hypothetical protein FOL46_008399 [Perkinsus olseni]
MSNAAHEVPLDGDSTEVPEYGRRVKALSDEILTEGLGPPPALLQFEEDPNPQPAVTIRRIFDHEWKIQGVSPLASRSLLSKRKKGPVDRILLLMMTGQDLAEAAIEVEMGVDELTKSMRGTTIGMYVLSQAVDGSKLKELKASSIWREYVQAYETHTTPFDIQLHDVTEDRAIHTETGSIADMFRLATSHSMVGSKKATEFSERFDASMQAATSGELTELLWWIADSDSRAQLEVSEKSGGAKQNWLDNEEVVGAVCEALSQRLPVALRACMNRVVSGRWYEDVLSVCIRVLGALGNLRLKRACREGERYERCLDAIYEVLEACAKKRSFSGDVVGLLAAACAKLTPLGNSMRKITRILKGSAISRVKELTATELVDVTWMVSYVHACTDQGFRKIMGAYLETVLFSSLSAQKIPEYPSMLVRMMLTFPKHARLKIQICQVLEVVEVRESLDAYGCALALKAVGKDLRKEAREELIEKVKRNIASLRPNEFALAISSVAEFASIVDTVETGSRMIEYVGAKDLPNLARAYGESFWEVKLANDGRYEDMGRDPIEDFFKRLLLAVVESIQNLPCAGISLILSETRRLNLDVDLLGEHLPAISRRLERATYPLERKTPKSVMNNPSKIDHVIDSEASMTLGSLVDLLWAVTRPTFVGVSPEEYENREWSFEAAIEKTLYMLATQDSPEMKADQIGRLWEVLARVAEFRNFLGGKKTLLRPGTLKGARRTTALRMAELSLEDIFFSVSLMLRVHKLCLEVVDGVVLEMVVLAVVRLDPVARPGKEEPSDGLDAAAGSLPFLEVPTEDSSECVRVQEDVVGLFIEDSEGGGCRVCALRDALRDHGFEGQAEVLWENIRVEYTG